MAKRRKRGSRRPRAAPVREVRYEGQPTIRLRDIVVWRKKGRFASPSSPGATRHRYVAQISALGRILDVVERTERHHVIRTVFPGAIEQNEGLIARALGETNAFTASAGASRVQVSVSFRNPEGRMESFKLDHHTVDAKGIAFARTDINNLMVGSIIQALRQRGYRTRYALQQVDWSHVQDKIRRTATGGRMNIAGRTQVSRRKEVTGLHVRIEMFK